MSQGCQPVRPWNIAPQISGAVQVLNTSEYRGQCIGDMLYQRDHDSNGAVARAGWRSPVRLNLSPSVVSAHVASAWKQRAALSSSTFDNRLPYPGQSFASSDITVRGQERGQGLGSVPWIFERPLPLKYDAFGRDDAHGDWGLHGGLLTEYRRLLIPYILTTQSSVAYRRNVTGTTKTCGCPVPDGTRDRYDPTAATKPGRCDGARIDWMYLSNTVFHLIMEPQFGRMLKMKPPAWTRQGGLH
jgi:hypothetical protein